MLLIQSTLLVMNTNQKKLFFSNVHQTTLLKISLNNLIFYFSYFYKMIVSSRNGLAVCIHVLTIRTSVGGGGTSQRDGMESQQVVLLTKEQTAAQREGAFVVGT